MSSQQNDLDQISKNSENRKSFSNTPNVALKSPISLNNKELSHESDPNENSATIVGHMMKCHEDELETTFQSEVQTPIAATNIDFSQQSNTIETEADRIAREQHDSELLAWQMMQEESAELYHIQIRFMQEIAGDMSAEDVRALQDAINESGRLDMLTSRAEANTISAVSIRTNSNESDQSDEFDEDDDNGNESSEVDDPDEWDYDRLLDLGQQLGDVKTDRWRQRAPQVIASLPNSTYATLQQQILAARTEQESESTTLSSPHLKKTRHVEDISSNPLSAPPSAIMVDYRCSICMGDFEGSDMLNILPCGHYFHAEDCCARWLTDHNSCPTCKAPVAKD
eukprot:gene22235-30475_t